MIYRCCRPGIKWSNIYVSILGFLLLENTFSRTIHFHGSIVVEGFFTLAFLKIRQKMNDLLQNTCFSIHHQQRKLPPAHSCWNELKYMAF